MWSVREEEAQCVIACEVKTGRSFKRIGKGGVSRLMVDQVFLSE